MKRVALGFGVVGAVVLGAAVLVATSTAAQRTQACLRLADLYAASKAQLQACGLTRAPLSGASTLPGGGVSYDYTLPDRQTSSVVETPVGFNPRKASPAEAKAYGIPPAPSPHSAGYAAWRTLTDGNYAPVHPHPYLVVGDHPLTQPPESSASPISSALSINYNSVWAGYSKSGSGWTETQVEYTEPTLGVTNCANPEVVFWTGIGSGNGNTALGQAGTSSGWDGGALHEVWHENLPGGPSFPGITAPAGKTVLVNVQYNANATNPKQKWVYNITVGDVNHVYYGTGPYDGSMVEAITERPHTSTGAPPLLNFKSITMQADIGQKLNPMANPDQAYVMGPNYATTGAISPDGSFTVTHDSCSG